ncbi:heparinase II/III domain-containing protein, partial [Agromyces seonyuensis]
LELRRVSFRSRRAARWVGDAEAAAHAAAHRLPGSPAADEAEGLGRLLRGVTDAEWIGAARAASPLPRDVWLPSTEVLLAREHAGTSDGLTLAVKGGHNGEHHNHNDVGSFVVAVDGVPVVVDAGRPTYTKQTFGPDRYDIWTMQSGWHNVPVIGGAEQPHGAAFAAAEVSVDLAEEASAFAAELAGAYPAGAAGSWRRSATLDRDARRVVISDRRTDDGPAELRLLLAGDVRLDGDAVLVAGLEDAPPLRISWPRGILARLERRELDDPMLGDVWGEALTRLVLDVAGRADVSVTLELAQSAGEGDR